MKQNNRIYLGIGALVFLFVLLACADARPQPFLWGLGSPPRRSVHGGNRPRPPLVAAHGPPHHPPHPHPAHHHHHHGQLPLQQRPIHHPHAPHGIHGPLPLTG